jgi:thiosulfate dehydrogenase [quinone] large subunit
VAREAQRAPTRFARVGPALAGAARVALGLLWLHEGIVKYRAGFGAADIELVVDGAAANPRVPAFFQAFTDTVLGAAPGFFGVAVPLLETLLGVALVLGVLTLPAAGASIATLMTYWLADQLVWQYPVMVLLAAAVLLFPAAASAWSLPRVLRRPTGRARVVAP